MARSRSGITEGAVNGWAALYLTNGVLAVTVLPGKGADIYEITDLATGIDPLFKAPWGLQPPGAPAREGSDGAAFLENYEGGWQELLPNTNDACTHQGTPVPFHGEVATRPWSVAVQADAGEHVAVRLSVDCETVPLRLERLMTLRSGQRGLELSERVTNRSAAPVQFTWGHHCVLGPPLVAAGAVLRTPARTIITAPQAWEDTARLEPGQRSAWPLAQGRDGSGAVDLSHVPGPEAASHDDVFLTGLGGGWAEVGHPAVGIAFRLEWDPAVFGWIISWQPYGGARAMPLRGAYALGIEPWAAGGNLEHAAATGEALRLDARAHLDTTLTASFRPW